MRFWFVLIAALGLVACGGEAPLAQSVGRLESQTGSFVEVAPFAVDGLPVQQLTIWLPPGYGSGEHRYPVLYMHDGHNLFDPAKSNFNKVWAVDKTILSLVNEGVIKPHIVVGIWAPGSDRYRQYLPYFLVEGASDDIGRGISELSEGKPIVSERYLEWIADELKPMIDREYRTMPGAGDTAIAGSSMGGLMSCYAFVERPDVFGRAACVSTHWPIVMPDRASPHSEEVKSRWREWFATKLGKADGRRVWMDHGTATLDVHYPPYQRAVNAGFQTAGWQEGRDWTSREYEGAGHEENAWAERLPEMLGWLLARD